MHEERKNKGGKDRISVQTIRNKRSGKREFEEKKERDQEKDRNQERERER